LIPVADRAWAPCRRRPLAGVHPATRLAGGVLAVLTALLAPAGWLVPLAAALLVLLREAGARTSGLGGQLRAWWPVALLVLAAHAVTATDIAPLWHPSWTGLLRGLLTLARLALMLGFTALAVRLLPLGDLVAALGWWLRPLRPLGVDTRHLGLVLAVALGTAPRVHADADRIGACLRLRRGAGRRRRWLDLRGRLLVVPPLMEGLVRRAETLPLAMAGRVPVAPLAPRRLAAAEALVLLAWTAALVVALL